MGELTCKLARECAFGEVMGQSSVLGLRGRKALSAEGVNLIKCTIMQHRYPSMTMESETYKSTWKYSPTSIIRTSDIRYLDYPDLRRASRNNRLWSRAPTRGPRF